MIEKIDISNRDGNIEIILDKEGMELEVFGGFMTKDKERKTVNVTVIHKARRTNANITLRGVCDDESSLSLVGTIIVEKSAEQTQSFLHEKVLLLSPKASAVAVPNLEIRTDDVKCSHAATISQIPKEHLFYLMSRGISRKEAQQLIVDGFLLNTL